MKEEWYICESGFLHNGGTKFLGPFVTQDLALTVRSYVEIVNKSKTYYVDSETVEIDDLPPSTTSDGELDDER